MSRQFGELLRRRPVLWVCALYLALTLAGGALLSLPQAASIELRHEEGDYLYKRILNCTFTAASAVSLTGLSIYDLGRDFSPFGQYVILGLMQIGGLATLIIAGFFAGVAGVPGGRAGSARRWITFVIGFVLLCEVAGAALLHGKFAAQPRPGFTSVFLAVSAFGNAGLTLWPDSLVDFRGDARTMITLLSLTLAGSFGTLMLLGLLRNRGRMLRWTLAAFAVTLLIAPLLLFAAESRESARGQERLPPEIVALMPPAMSDLPSGERAAAATFLSVGARSAGFRTVALDASALSRAGMVWLCVLMFLGGAPGSAAGGVSVLALAILFARAARPRNAPSPASGAIRPVMLLIGLTLVAASALCLTERGAGLSERIFEAISAVSSSGLSMGLTPRLSIPGRVVLIIAMLSGRIITVTLIASLWRRAMASFDGPREARL